MPIPALVAAPLLAVVLAAVLTLATPALLHWLPIPPDEGEVAPFSELATPGFRGAVFGCSAVAGAVVFACLPPTAWPAWAGLVTLGVLLGLIDLRTTFLPLRLTYLAVTLAAAGAVVTALLEGSWWVLASAAAAGAVGAGVFWLIWRVSHGFAFGDVRLAGLIGLVAGTSGGPFAFAAFFLGTLIGAAWALVLRWRRGTDDPFAYGPALLLGPLAALLIATLGQPG
ncbi:MAG TPA: prepilin peptidase [Propionicimonas sp.]|uniref:prepilin peptidase n=1 Tax=Propionicimonas sp. TaxID=1955623 RepID=UPI002F3FAD67